QRAVRVRLPLLLGGQRRRPCQQTSAQSREEAATREPGSHVRHCEAPCLPVGGTGRTQETCVIKTSSAAKETADDVAKRGVSVAGKVACVASPTRKVLKSFARFL